MKKWCVALLVFVLAAPLRAETVDSVPNPLHQQRWWVSDGAKAINNDDTLAINRAIEDLKVRTGAEIAVVTVQNTGDDSAKEFATALFNRWKVGQKGKDNGIVLLMAMQKRRVAVEIGYGIEGELPDGKAMDIVRDRAVPRFKQGDYGGGLLAVVQEFSQVLSGGASSPAPKKTPGLTQRQTAPRKAPYQAPPVYREPIYNEPNYGQPSVAGPFDLLIGLFILMIFPLGIGVFIWIVFKIVKGLNTRQCPQCKRTMRYLNELEDDAFLDQGQRLEETLGGLDWRVWRCDTCNLQHIERSVKFLGGHEDCPRCRHHTVKFDSATLRLPTYYDEGVREVTRTCHFPDCNYSHRTHEVMPRRQRESNVIIVGGLGSHHGTSWGDSGGFGGGSSSSSSSSSDSGFSSGSSDFGGGSSGGGGGETGW